MLSLNNKKKALRELWSCRVGGGEDGDVGDEDWVEKAHAPWKSLMRQRETKELNGFVSTLKRSGSEPGAGACLPLTREPVVICGETVAPELLSARLFRWPDLRAGDGLRRIGVRGVCDYGARMESKREEAAASPAADVCCNPFHFGRLLRCGEAAGQACVRDLAPSCSNVMFVRVNAACVCVFVACVFALVTSLTTELSP